MARIFISHSSANNAEALALRDWLVARGWDDLFLDIDPHRGLVSGQRWLDRLQESAQRCKAVLFVLSRAWLASRYCTAEFWEARKQERPLFAVVIDDTAMDEVPAEMRGVWQLALLTRGSRFETFSVKPPPDYVSTPVRFSYEGLESLRLGLAQAGLTSFDTESFPWPAPGFEHEADGTTPRRPYRGLKPLDVPDAGVFFGRDADLVRARDHLADLRDRGGRCLVVILGASGSGKSSFLRAGLLPRLVRDDRRFLPLPVLRPRGAAMWGDEGLLTVLETAHRKAGLAFTRADLRKDLEAGGAGFLRRLADLRSAAARGLPEDTKPPTLILPIDQAEELFTTVRGDRPAEAILFLARLAEILRHGPEALALVTIRSDAYEPLQTAEALAGVPQIPVNLPPLTAADYRSVIEGPADRATGAWRPLILEPELVKALLADAQGTDALPLLGFTLERLYVEHGGDGALTLADYEALGGVQGSIEAAVDEAFADPDAVPRIPADAAEREKFLKRAFVPHLMGVNEANGEPVRRTARLVDLPAETRGLVDRLIERRLLVVDRRAEETVIEVAHEALLRRWPTLQRWLDEERAALQAQQEVARAASAWSQNGCKANSDWLTHRGSRLAEAEAVARREDFDKVFEGVPRAYLDACRQAEEASRDAEARRLARQRIMQRRVGMLLTIVALITLIGGWLVVTGRRELVRQRSRSIAADATKAFEAGHYDRAIRLALVASQGSWLTPPSLNAEIQLGRAAHFSQLEAQLTGYEWEVVSAAFSPDGKRIVTVSVEEPAHVWSQGEDGTWTRVTLKGHQGTVNSATFSPDGARIVTASADGTARVWSRREDGTWTSVVLTGHRKSILSAAFSADGGYIVTASADTTARVWNRGEEGAWTSVALEGHQDSVISASSSPGGACIVTASVDGTVRVWSRREDGTWTSVVLERHQGEFNSATFSPDGARIVTASDGGTAHVWNRRKDDTWTSVTLEGHQDWVSSASFSPDGARIVTASLDNSARVWSRRENGTWTSVVLEGHQGGINSAIFSPDGARIVTASDDGTTHVWNRRKDDTWTSVTLEGHQFYVRSVAFSLDGTRVVTASDDNTARVWSLGKGDAWGSVVLEGHQGPESFSSDDARTNTLLEDEECEYDVGGARIVTVPYESDIALVWSCGENGTWTSVALEGHEIWVHSASFSPDNSRILTADDESVRIWSQGEEGAWTSVVLKGHEDWVISATFSPDGSRIVTLLDDGTTRVWDARWLIGPGDWAKAEPLSLPETVCREKLRGSWTTVKDPKTGRNVERIAERLLTADDIKAAPILAGREGEDVCAPFLESRSWWSRLAFWR